MQNMKAKIKLIITILLFGSCGTTSYKYEELVEKIKSNPNYLKSVDLEEYHYNILLKPEAIVNYEREFESTEQGEYLWFNIEFSINGFNQSPLRYNINSYNDFTNNLDYYANRANKDIYILSGKDTIYPSSYWFEYNQNLTNKELIIVGFKYATKTIKNDIQLVINDLIAHNGILKTTFDYKTVSKTYKIK